MLRGDVQFAMDGLASYLQVVRQGLVRALAITSSERSPLVPETPTMAELGMAEFSLTSWGGFAAPAGTPEPILRLLADALGGIAARPEMQERFQALAARLIAGDGAAMRERMDRERPIWGELVRISGARST
jgi:tripartite-type tricarboxylate transporter receptor subunit TctC